MKKITHKGLELFVLILFLLINISLSINCFFFNYAGRQASSGKSGYTGKEISHAPQKLPWLSNNFYDIIDAKIETKNPNLIRFIMKKDGDFCLLLRGTSIFYGSDIINCTEANTENYIETLWLFSKEPSLNKYPYAFYSDFIYFPKEFPDKIFTVNRIEKILYVFSLNSKTKEVSFLKTVQQGTKEYEKFLSAITNARFTKKFNSILKIESSQTNKTYYFLFSDPNQLSELAQGFLHWDISYNKTRAREKNNISGSELFWGLMQPIAFIVDVITLPIQVIGGFLYIMIFGIK